MKQLLILIFFLFVHLLAGCYKQHPMPSRRTIGYFEADLNGRNWNTTYKNAYQTVESDINSYSTSMPCTKDYLEVFTELYSSQGYLRHKLHLMKIPQKAGMNKIIASRVFQCDEKDPVYADLSMIMQDGDVLGDVYGPAEGFDNYLNIEMYNSKTGEIKGTFQMTMVKTRDGGEPVLPDTLRFTNGRFHTRFVQDY
jgi:hypothetical protein